MRKTISLTLALLLTVSLAGCDVMRPVTTQGATTAAPVVTKPAATGSTTVPQSTIAPATTMPLTTAVETTTPTTEAPPEETKSNLPANLKAELDNDENGLMLIYYPDKFPEIKAITRWNIINYDTNTQVFVVTKKKGSIVEVSEAELTNDDRIVIPGEVIRDWETTSDYEVIRILYTDPETIPYNFIKVKEPNGKVTTTHLRTSMRDNPDWEVYKYDE